MNNKLIENLVAVNKNLIIPDYIIKYYSKLNLEGLSFILMIYFINQKENITFDINKISKDLNLEQSVVLGLINELNEKNYISIEMIKKNGIIEEFISVELFYNKICSLLIESKDENENNDIYSMFEQEFGRVLSPMEYQTINGWLENKIPVDLITAALKESVLSGVNNLRYIDKILFEWNKKGYKKVEDIKQKKDNKDDDYIEEIFDYDWINDDTK